MTGRTSHEQGSISEAIVLSELKRLDVTVSMPWGRPRYDMVIDVDEELYRAQVKTAHLENEDSCIVFECRSGHINSKGNKKISYTGDEIDCFLVYSPDVDNVYWVGIEETGKSSMTLRLKEPKKHGGGAQINWHEDYLLGSRL